MTNRAPWLNRIGLALIWIALTAAVAFFVARNAVPDATSSSGELDVPRIGSDQRATVVLKTQFVQPVVSGDGRVVELEDVRGA